MRTKVKVLLMTVVFTLLLAGTVFAAPGKVTGLKQTDGDTYFIDVEWDESFNTDISYEVSMSTDQKTWEVVEESINHSSYYRSGLRAGKNYYIRVRSIQSGIYGEYSDVLTVVTAPNRVENIRQTSATASSITLSWDKVEGATAYQVWHGSKLLGKTTTTSYTIKGLSNKDDLPSGYLVIRPVRKIGEYEAVNSADGIYLNEVYFPGLKLVPYKVKNFKISDFWDNGVNFEYDNSKYSEGEIYELYNYKNKKVKTGECRHGWSATDLKIRKGQFFKLRMREYVKFGQQRKYGEWSNNIYCALKPVVKVRKSGKKFNVSWKKIKGATSYTVYMSKNEFSGYKKITTTKKLKKSVSKFRNKKLKKEQRYYFKVVANKKVRKKTYKSAEERVSIDY